jgi:hypothetical protein
MMSESERTSSGPDATGGQREVYLVIEPEQVHGRRSRAW